MTARRLVNVVVVLLMAGLVIVMLVVRSGGSSRPSEASTTNAQTGSSHTSPSEQPTTPTTTSGKPEGADDTASVLAQSRHIVEQYYLLFPADTEADRSARISAAVDTSKMSSRDFTVGTNSCWDQARILYILTEKALIPEANIEVEKIDPAGSHIVVTVPGTLRQYEKSGEPFAGSDGCPNLQSFVAVLEWQLVDGEWTLVHFSNPGRSP